MVRWPVRSIPHGGPTLAMYVHHPTETIAHHGVGNISCGPEVGTENTSMGPVVCVFFLVRLVVSNPLSR